MIFEFLNHRHFKIIQIVYRIPLYAEAYPTTQIVYG